MTMGILAILQRPQHSRLCKISSEIEKSSGDYHLIILSEILTEVLTEAANCYISILRL